MDGAGVEGGGGGGGGLWSFGSTFWNDVREQKHIVGLCVDRWNALYTAVCGRSKLPRRRVEVVQISSRSKR